MVFVIAIVFVIIGAVLICVDRYTDWTFGIGIVLFIVSLFVLLLSGAFSIEANVNIDAKEAQLEARYESLMYKMESTTCRDEFGFLNKEIIDEVSQWNEDIAYGKSAQRDLWAGPFVPNIYDQFDFIKYDNFVIE